MKIYICRNNYAPYAIVAWLVPAAIHKGRVQEETTATSRYLNRQPHLREVHPVIADEALATGKWAENSCSAGDYFLIQGRSWIRNASLCTHQAETITRLVLLPKPQLTSIIYPYVPSCLIQVQNLQSSTVLQYNFHTRFTRRNLNNLMTKLRNYQDHIFSTLTVSNIQTYVVICETLTTSLSSYSGCHHQKINTITVENVAEHLLVVIHSHKLQN